VEVFPTVQVPRQRPTAVYNRTVVAKMWLVGLGIL